MLLQLLLLMMMMGMRMMCVSISYVSIMPPLVLVWLSR